MYLTLSKKHSMLNCTGSETIGEMDEHLTPNRFFKNNIPDSVEIRVNDSRILVRGVWTGRRFLCTSFDKLEGTFVPDALTMCRLAHRERSLREEAVLDFDIALSMEL